MVVDSPSGTHALRIVQATGLAVLGIALGETTRVVDHDGLVFAFADLLVLLLRHFVAPLAAIVVLALIVAYLKRWRFAAVTLAAGAAVSGLYLHLVSYPPFRGFLPFVAVAIGLWALVAVGLGHALVPRFEPWKRHLRIAFCVVSAAGVAGTEYVNYSQYVDRYPTLHYALLGGSLLLAIVGVFNLLGTLGDWVTRPAWGLLGLAAALWVIGAVLGSAMSDDMRLSIAEDTVAGSVPLGDTDLGDPSELTCGAAPEALGGSEAVEIFERYSGLPPLPPDFQLRDYNVIVVIVDSLRFDQTSLAQPALDTSPTLAKMSAAGAFDFRRAYAPSSATFQSVASLVSLSVPSHSPLRVHKHRYWIGALGREIRTVAEAFAESGYRTFLASHPGIAVCDGCEQGFQLQTLGPKRSDPAADETLATRAIGLMNTLSAQEAPLFGWIFLASPHDEYLAHGSSGGEPLDLYRGEIRYADRQIGRLLEQIKSLRRPTVVIVTGDHGEEFMEHGHNFHSLTVFGESIHVPLLIDVPGTTGGEQRGPTSIAYALPWLMLRGEGALRSAAVQAIQRDLAPIMRATEGAVVAELVARGKMLITLIGQRYKLNYQSRTGAVDLYDLDSDPGELKPGAAITPEVTARWKRRLHAYRALRACNKRYTISDGRRLPIEF